MFRALDIPPPSRSILGLLLLMMVMMMPPRAFGSARSKGSVAVLVGASEPGLAGTARDIREAVMGSVYAVGRRVVVNTRVRDAAELARGREALDAAVSELRPGLSTQRIRRLRLVADLAEERLRKSAGDVQIAEWVRLARAQGILLALDGREKAARERFALAFALGAGPGARALLGPDFSKLLPVARRARRNRKRGAPGRLVIRGLSAVARVFLDGRLLPGRLPPGRGDRSLEVSPGPHLLQVMAEGYFRDAKVLKIKPRAAIRIRFKLRELPGEAARRALERKLLSAMKGGGKAPLGDLVEMREMLRSRDLIMVMVEPAPGGTVRVRATVLDGQGRASRLEHTLIPGRPGYRELSNLLSKILNPVEDDGLSPR